MEKRRCEKPIGDGEVCAMEQPARDDGSIESRGSEDSYDTASEKKQIARTNMKLQQRDFVVSETTGKRLETMGLARTISRREACRMQCEQHLWIAEAGFVRRKAKQGPVKLQREPSRIETGGKRKARGKIIRNTRNQKARNEKNAQASHRA